MVVCCVAAAALCVVLSDEVVEPGWLCNEGWMTRWMLPVWNLLPPKKAATSTSGSGVDVMTEMDNEAILNLDSSQPFIHKILRSVDR